jgi:putative SOS response-associated peptidase YedK
MCGRYTVAVDPQLLAERFGVGLPEDFEPRFNVAPTDGVLALTERSAGRELMTARWGLIPRWAKDTKAGARMINARAESLAEKPAYRPLLEKNRCLILADGFYEFTASADSTAKRKDRWLFADPGGAMLGIAGLVRTVPQIGEAFTMLTTEPGADVAPYHNRQVALLPEAGWRAWLDHSLPAAELIRPLPAGSLSVQPAPR